MRRRRRRIFWGGSTLIPEVRCSNPGPGGPFFPYFLGILLVYSGPPLDSRFDQIYQIYGLEYLIV
ncbi:uncharacterized protein CLUP02_09705 [Colletotrichum lupini]|uniref:Uncharacterized protein n=1 Tax=Colletotrichum lupini TaxID=145971 RepID=A0A9Q8SV88_9PEZI|nr:uncharacterized protein CLUP02_09705 [Colletotrichum lupini]UQC84209.1 hypothetical protein CLUP02_09705 [Colletotrichum lupini]